MCEAVCLCSRRDGLKVLPVCGCKEQKRSVEETLSLLLACLRRLSLTGTGANYLSKRKGILFIYLFLAFR